MKKRIFSVLLTLVMLLTLGLVTAAPVGAGAPGWVAGAPEIDGIIDDGEWDGATASTSGSGIYTVFTLNDSEYLYVAFEAVGGDYTIASSMTNIYIYVGDDWGGECWAYTAGAPGQDVGLTYFTTHHIPDPKVKEGLESRSTTAIVEVSTLVAEWQIPLAEFPMGPGDPLAFDFLSYSEGVSGWNDWIFEQEYWALVQNQDTDLYYTTIQAAIDAASEGDTISVGDGTYPEDVTVDKDLILEGAQAGICAVGGRTGDESEIVGSIKVVSPAEHVAIDGFTITGTGAGPLAGVCVRTQLASVTFVNNIVNAVEATGGYTYSGIVDLDGLSEAFVGCNSFSGAYEADRAPNVIRLGISGDGTVTVEYNEMHEVGGGGGVGVMCTNEGAVINILGNDIDQCGDGIWSYNSIFDVLRIDGNQIHHNNACHGGACENIDTGVKLVGTLNGEVVIDDNDFHDNTIQVDNSAGVVDLEQVLANNTFDRAVVVDNPGSSLLPIIWSSIQDGVDATVAGDTVAVLPGIYPEDVTVSTANLTLVSVSMHDAVVEGTIVVNANGVTVDGFTITDFSQIPTPDWSAIYVPSGTGVVIANNSIDGAGIDPVANLTVGIHTLFGGCADITAQDNTITNVRMGIYNQGAEMLITGNTIDGATSTNPHCGIGVDTSLGTEIIENDIINNDIGIEVFQTGVVAHYNNLCGNTEYGIWSAGPVVDAVNNYWCHPSGPHHSPGLGVPVSDNVLYNPWLLEPLVPGAPLPTTFEKTLTLNIGWTLVSTDNWIDPAKTVGVGVILAYNYIPDDGWVEVTPAALVPVDALYVKTEVGGALGIIYSGGYPAPSSKDLKAGWNLISSATATIGNARAVLSPLRYIDVGEEQGVGLATLVSQGNYNQHTESFTLATFGVQDWFALGQTTLNPFDGYWVYMNADKSFGVIPE